MQSSLRIVPIRGESLVPAAHAPHLSYHQGHLLTAVEVYTIFWGTGWLQDPQSGLIQDLNNFFDFILTSPLMDLLGEYSVAGQQIGHGRRVGTKPIITSEPGTVQHDGRMIVTDSEIRTALKGLISHSTVIQPGSNTLYFIYLPPNVVSQDEGGSSCTPGGYCGYHDAIDNRIFYCVVPYLPCPGCQSGQNQPLDTLTEVSSHELCEAITDPDPFTGWNDLKSGEIGDICNFEAAQLGGYNVQKQWSNAAGECLTSPASDRWLEPILAVMMATRTV